ncbi:hypothetical protein [Saccharophagus degradans]|uniref:Uncharacterized protein n=1 Tax=Saccharophagus degradans (strain 2-40 / ATCC 43961 / DSM 17024) TaxID=203122 RepID=Q21I51_SACD2|nr:hypothetical protein [Saccharophagus degradans]ABD81628.1 hypothetical protein Sde_2368 [Saccharophagus degradans 2-40]
MNYKSITTATLLCAAISSGAVAQESAQATANHSSEAELDLLMMVVDESDTPTTVVNRIPLPPAIVEEIALPDVELEEPALDNVQETVDSIASETTTAVTEAVNDIISSGSLGSLPDDITDAIPAEDIGDAVGEAIEGIEDVIDLDESVNIDTEINSAIDDLESSLDAAELDSAIDNLENDVTLESLEGSIETELESDLETELNTETDESNTVLDGVDLGL